jgi:hypothetical protein
MPRCEQSGACQRFGQPIARFDPLFPCRESDLPWPKPFKGATLGLETATDLANVGFNKEISVARRRPDST